MTKKTGKTHRTQTDRLPCPPGAGPTLAHRAADRSAPAARRWLSTCVQLALAFSLLPGAALPSLAADDPAIQKLIDQARYWQQKKREDLAADVWRKLLRADPNHPLALIQLGSIEARAGHSKEAEELYQRAKALSVAPAGLAELETALKVEKAAPTELSTARKQAETGQTEQAVKTYQNILGDTQPAGQFGLEYYETLGGTREGWDEARRGLEQLARANPGDTRYLLALARHLTYRESTRREGIRQLAHLTGQDSSSKDAQKAWRQALVWLLAHPGDKALFQQYLSLFANDQAIRERLRQLERPTFVAAKPNLEDIERQAGFKWLDSGDVDKAEARFKAILAKKPGDLDAMGGLATVMMRKGQWTEASALLDQVVGSSKGRGKRWRGAQQSAHYWTLMNEINEMRQSDPNLDITDKLQQALKIDPKEPSGLVLLADLVAEKREFAKAEPLYRQVLQKQPSHSGAFLGLINVLSQTGREQEALALVAAQTASPELKMVGLNQAKAQALFKLAQTDEQNGNLDSAVQRMEDALLLDPASPWIRLALARLYQHMNDPAGANALVDNLIDTFPDLPEAQHARALLFAEQERPLDALVALERIAPNKRTPAMAQDQRRLWIQVQVLRARQLQQLGQNQQSAELLAQAQTAAGRDLNLLGMVAGGWAETGQHQRALQILRDVHSRNGVQDVASKIQYAALLLNTQQDAELSAVLRDLSRQPNLTPKQFDDINKIILALTLRQTDTLREAGRLAEAFDTVSPALAQSNDPKLMMALARIYQSGNDPVSSLQLAESVIEREPDDLNHRLFAAGVAMAAKQLDRAALHANAALELAPDHPRALAQVGRVEKLRGNTAKALEYFQYAQALEREKGAFTNVPGNLALRLVDANPSVPALLSAPNAARNQLLPLPGRRSSEVPGNPQFNPVAPANGSGAVLPLPGARPPAVRQFADPLSYGNNAAVAPTPVYASASTAYAAPANGYAAPANTYAAPVASPVASPYTNTPPTAASTGAANLSAKAVPPAPVTATAAATIYQAAYQAALDSFQGGKKRSKRHRSKKAKNTAREPGNDDIVQQALAGLGQPKTSSAPQPLVAPGSPAAGSYQPGASVPVPDWRSNALAPRVELAPIVQPRPSATRLPTLSSLNAAGTAGIRADGSLSANPGSSSQSTVTSSPTSPPSSSRFSLARLFGSDDANPSAPANPALATTGSNPASSAAPTQRERTVSEEIADIELKITTTLDVAAAYRNRSGETGTSRLSEIEIPVEFKTSLDYDHTLTLRMTPVLLSAGELVLADPNHATTFGSGALGPFLARPYPNATQDASGVALALGVDGDQWHADIGTTPLGFRITNLVGGFSYKNTVDDLTLKLSLNRRAVTDSVLSYAGARDPLTGSNWGGVVKTGLRLDGSFGEDQYGLYAGAGIATLTGRNVKTNNEFEATVGAYIKPWQTGNTQLTLGLNLNALGYRSNLSHFTLGHGGYFSPQRYVSLGLPVDIAGRWGRLSYKLGVDGGFRHITQDRAVYFPNDDALQIAWQNRIAANAPLAVYNSLYPGDTSSGFGVNINASFEYLIAPKFALGGRLGFDNSRNFTQQSGLIYLRYAFSPLAQPVLFPPRPTTPLSNGEPL